MRVKLTQNIMEGHGVKISVRKPPRKSVPLVEGTVIEMSDASAAKYIEKGWAVQCDEPAVDGEQA